MEHNLLTPDKTFKPALKYWGAQGIPVRLLDPISAEGITGAYIVLVHHLVAVLQNAACKRLDL